MVACLEICVPLSSGPRGNHRASPKKKRTLATNHGSRKPRIIGATLPRLHAGGGVAPLTFCHRRAAATPLPKSKSPAATVRGRGPPAVSRGPHPHSHAPPHAPFFRPLATDSGRGACSPHAKLCVRPRVPRHGHPSPSRVPRRLSDATNGRDSVCRVGAAAPTPPQTARPSRDGRRAPHNGREPTDRSSRGRAGW